MSILNSIASWLMKKRMHQIELFIKYPFDVQQEWLQQLLREGSKTEFGRLFNMEHITNYDQFSAQIPLQDYEQLKPYITLMQQGSQNLLWPGEIQWFAKSSGTTDKSKFLPVSTESLENCHYKAGMDMVTLYCSNYPETKLFKGKNLALGGSLKSHRSGTFTSLQGDVSAIIIQHLPFWAEYFRAPDRSIALMDEWSEKLEHMAQQMCRENVTSLAGVPSWMLVLLHRVLEVRQSKELCEVWPDLEVYFHGGVGFMPYREHFDRINGLKPLRYLQVYNASEGFFGIQDQRDANDMLLMLDYGIFYEFQEVMGHHSTKVSPVVPLSGVKLHTDYALIITTNAGLWRYQIGDIVRFTSLHPYRIIISGRTKQYLNVFGEELMIHNTDEAMAYACQKTHSRMREYTVAPIYMSQHSGAHEWLIEFDKAPEHPSYFMSLVDQFLKSNNSDYEAKRYNDFVLSFPKLQILSENTFLKWLKSKHKLGGQHKVPRLSNTRTMAEELLNISTCK